MSFSTTLLFCHVTRTTFNTLQTWDLLLNRPYNDGGSEDSRRIDPENGWTMLPPLYCAVHVNGPINDPSVENDGWSVEIALPLASLMERQAEAGCGPDKTPAEGVLWRLGFRCPLSMPPPLFRSNLHFTSPAHAYSQPQQSLLLSGVRGTQN